MRQLHPSDGNWAVVPRLLVWSGKKDLATFFISLFLSAPLSPICSLSGHNHGDEGDARPRPRERGGIGLG